MPLIADGQPLIWTVPLTRHIVLIPAEAKTPDDGNIIIYAGKIDGVWFLAAGRRGRTGESQPAAVIDKYTGPAANHRPAGGPEKYEAVKIGMSRERVFENPGQGPGPQDAGDWGSQEAYEWEYRGGTITVGFNDGLAEWKANTFVNR